MRIALLHSEVPKNARSDDLDTMVQVEAISHVFREAGHEAITVACGLDLAAVRGTLTALKPGLVFNLVETIDGTDRLLHFAAALVERLGLPMTGCSASGLYRTGDKLLAKETLLAHGLPVPDRFEPRPPRGARAVLPSGKLIIKSLSEHASVGLDASSVVQPTSVATLVAALDERRTALGGEWFAEQFIDGREFNLSVIEGSDGPRALPPAEIRFVDFPKDKPRIVDFRAKWDTDSFEYRHTVRSFDFPTKDAPLLEALRSLALRAFDAFSLSGYARVDFRVDEAGRPFILEVNANPCLSPDAGFAAAAELGGLSYDALVFEIAGAALGNRDILKKISVKTEDAPLQNPPVHFRRHVTADDRNRIENVVRGTGFFSEAEVDIALELVDDFLARGTAGGYHFLVCEENEALTGFSIFGPIPGTLSSFDLYWIATAVPRQGKGIGRTVLKKTEARIRTLGGTRVYAETSGRSRYRSTRSFYERNGYAQEARNENYYGPDDDRLIYVKALS